MAVGHLEAIVGCMFSGKTTELISRLNAAELAGKKIQVFKPRLDDRYADDQIVSHGKKSWPALPIAGSIKILELIENDVEVIGIDEAQFFDEFLPQVINVLVMKGKTIYIAGLDTDWRGRPFGPVPSILSYASNVRKMYASCATCQEPAIRSQRLVDNDQDVLLGTAEYEPRCLEHFRVPTFIDKEEQISSLKTPEVSV